MWSNLICLNLTCFVIILSVLYEEPYFGVHLFFLTPFLSPKILFSISVMIQPFYIRVILEN